MASETERSCSAHVDGEPCGEPARHEVRFGGEVTLPLCADHLADCRRTAEQWGREGEFDALTRAITRLNPI